MTEIYIGLGSNLGNRKKNICLAIDYIKKDKRIILDKVSPFYLSTPVLPRRTKISMVEKQKNYINCVVKIESGMTVDQLLKVLQKIELRLHKKKKYKWSPRSIDLDILFFDKKIIRKKNLVIPHRELHKRKFVLKPLIDICPDFVHPVFNKTVTELYLKIKNDKNQKLIRIK
jgi:2-amino-4-hydroxy-6-hydroxymethyldihydropteridine diphosphokinase